MAVVTEAAAGAGTVVVAVLSAVLEAVDATMSSDGDEALAVAA